MPKITPKSSEEEAVKNGFNAVIELFNRRWTMRILWELRTRPITFREIQAACGEVSSSVLNVRLSQLREAHLVAHSPGEGYALTKWGQELLVEMRPMANWAARWYRATKQ